MKTASFVAFWISAAFLVFDQIGWLYQACFRPRTELRLLLGYIPESIRVVGYRNGVGPHGGTMLWNFDLSPEAADRLRARCASPGYVRPLSETSSVARPGPITQPNGCVIGGRTSEEQTYSEAVLQDHLLQLLVAM